MVGTGMSSETWQLGNSLRALHSSASLPWALEVTGKVTLAQSQAKDTSGGEDPRWGGVPLAAASMQGASSPRLPSGGGSGSLEAKYPCLVNLKINRKATKSMFQLLHTSCSNSQLCTGDVNLSTEAASFACLGGDKTHNLATGCPLVWAVFFFFLIKLN